MAQTDNLTIMFVDMVGFTERTAQQSRSQNTAMLRALHRALLPVVAQFGGRHVKSIGDALLVTFHSPTDGVHCGMALHDALAELNQKRDPREHLKIRVAVNVGEVRTERRDIFGEAVNVAARVEGLTPPDEVYFTEAVYLAMNKAEVQCEPIGARELKGIPEPVKLYRVPPRQVPRLVPTGETLDAESGELPFGGMHKTRDDRALMARLSSHVQALSMRQKVQIAGLGLVVVLLASLLYVSVNRVAPVPAGPDVDVARDMVELGHSAYAAGRKQDAMLAYKRALAINPGLRDDPVLAANLVGGLSWAREQAQPLIVANPSPAVIDALARRTAQEGRLGAQRAADLLQQMGHGGRIDHAGLAIVQLQEASNCEGRLQAVTRLRALRDPRALPALRSVTGGVTGWWQHGCLQDEARAAIAEIEKQAPRPAAPPS